MPNRILKESICTSETLNELAVDAENLFYRLIVQCDDFGRMDARPAIVRAKCYPLRTDAINCNQIKDWINSLVLAGLIIVYTVNEKEYLQMVTWKRHQQVRAAKSKYPDPPVKANLQSPANNCNQVISDSLVIDNENDNDIRESLLENDNENDNGSRDGVDESCSGSCERNNNLSSDEIMEVTTKFEEAICKITPGIAIELNQAIQKHLKTELLDAVKACEMQNKHTMAYFLGCLRKENDRSTGPPKNKYQVDPDKFIKGKYGHMVQR